ncbi:hypothetical protein B566_EDAN011891 [Ephemera danica]|nr:hypothetical protein B566_EDAN011890 [Ephemera danica]KAF4525714.1 hypothetical protein B566_EDAN011891 [Ephemera danica]
MVYRECDEVPAPALGRVRLTGRLFGDRAIYSCEEGTGTRLVGLSERVCQADGQWAGSPPVCNKDVFCGEAPRIEHARHTALPAQRSFPVDTTLQYQCQPGYATTGFPHAKCLALDGSASWYGPDITCERKK